MNQAPEEVGIIGAGNFGQTLAKLISLNTNVLIYSRRSMSDDDLTRLSKDRKFRISNTQDMADFCKRCEVIIPVVPSFHFRQVLKYFSAQLHPYHILIHSIKGLDLILDIPDDQIKKVNRSHVRTMSQIIREETRVVRIGCISGPNLSTEILAGLPAATVVASNFDEVVTLGNTILASPGFKIYGSHDLLGTELAGALKNMIAIGTGIAAGLQLGKNIEALLITRGLREMILIGQALGAESKTFFGTAGLGDLIATATSVQSRNFRFGYKIGSGEEPHLIMANSSELVEGVRTIRLMYHLSRSAKIDVPILDVLYAMIFQKLPISMAMSYLLDYPYSLDVDFLHTDNESPN